MADNIKKMGWYFLLVFFFLGLGGSLVILSGRVNYNWYWNQIPQYILFVGTDTFSALSNGEVKIESLDEQYSLVTFQYDDGTEDQYKLLTKTIHFEDGDLVSEGEDLGADNVIRPGILLIGLYTTLEISLYSGILGLLIGLFVGLSKLSKNPFLHGISSIYIEIIRGTPLLIQIFIFYFFLGTILELERMTAGVLALAIFTGAYAGEIIRAGVQSIDRGQTEAARALGMNYVQTMIYIVLPQALKRVLPALAGQFISLVKDSSLVSVIAITDLTKAGREVISSTFATFEIWFSVAGMYFVLTFFLSSVVRYLERRLAVSD